MSTGTLSEVPIVAFFGRDSENIAARLKGSSHAGRGKRCASDHAGNLLELRTGPFEIAGHFNIETAGLIGLCVDQIDVARLLIYYGVGSGRSSHNVEIFVPR